MKLNRITASLITVLGSNMLVMPAVADRIIQKPSGAFYIVSDQEASSVFDRNNFGFFSLPPSVNYPTYTRPAKVKAKKVRPKKTAVKKQVQCVPVSCPVTPVKPVTTVESAESIFLRLEKKNK